jgi:DNA repair protein RecN (Recombination protein N)
MLTELRIANFAIIDQLSLECARGLHVLTGETGAGKSIIIDAIALLVGGRADDSLIRAEAEEAVLEAAITLPPASPLVARLREAGLLGDGETELIVRRVLSRSGRHKLYLNGSLTPLKTLQSLAGTLIDIHGQHEQQSLLSAQSQMDALDASGHLKEARENYRQAYERWKTCQREREEMAALLAERSQREDLLRFQHGELQEADVKAGEEAALQADRNRLAHAHRLNELSRGSYDILYGDEQSVLGSLGKVRDSIKDLAAIDAQGNEWAALCDGAAAQLRELAHHLRKYHEGLDQDPSRLAQIEERLDRIQRLKKKYGGTEEALLAKREQLQREIDALDSGDVRLAELDRRLTDSRQQADRLAERLTRERVKAAKKLEARVADELAALRMDRTRLVVAVTTDRTDAGLGPFGRDRIEYQFSANEGEPLQPLARVASGGELSRVMLAMKTVLAEADEVPIVIFDEIDAGVGGGVAAVMGQRLRALARRRQVFCITHLPQIAAYADVHYLIEKGLSKKRTVTQARKLGQAERQEEIARMLGGLAVTNAARKTAAEMIGEAGGQR